MKREPRRSAGYSPSFDFSSGAALESAVPPFLREIRIVDLFELPEARAITFELEYLSDEALTGETINAATEAMMSAVTARFGDRVTLRA